MSQNKTCSRCGKDYSGDKCEKCAEKKTYIAILTDVKG